VFGRVFLERDFWSMVFNVILETSIEDKDFEVNNQLLCYCFLTDEVIYVYVYIYCVAQVFC
jgi:hypothetical protein